MTFLVKILALVDRGYSPRNWVTKMEKRGSSAEWMGWVLVLLGALLAFTAGRQVANLVAAGDPWVSLPATVIRTRVASLAGSTSAQERTFRVVQEVVYFVNGRRYQGSLDLGRFEDRASAVAAAQEAERTGASIRVWVHANQLAAPSRQPVQREAGYGQIALYGLLGLFAMPLGASLLRSSTRRQGSIATSGGPQPITSH